VKHTVDELTETVHRYYARGMSHEDPRRRQTEEYRRLSAARRQAGADNEPWRALLRNAHARFPDCSPSDGSLHLPTGEHDAGYCGALVLPHMPGEHPRTVGFLISFLVPYYVIYSTRTVDDVERKPAPDAARVQIFYHRDTMYVLPRRWWSRLLAKAVDGLNRIGESRSRAPDDPMLARVREMKNAAPGRRDIHLDLSPEEQPYGTWLAQEIEATWGCSPMPPEVGNVIVSDVATSGRAIGEARLFDCLFLDSW
jgi:hypothetical protein